MSTLKQKPTKPYVRMATKKTLKMSPSKTATKLQLLESPEVPTDPKSTIQTLEKDTRAMRRNQSLDNLIFNSIRIIYGQSGTIKPIEGENFALLESQLSEHKHRR